MGGDAAEDGLAVSIVHVADPAECEKLRVSVSSATVVVWLNRSADAVRIVLPGGTVALSTLSPVNFSYTADGGADSGWIAPGAIASLCFVQPGTYAFRIEYSEGPGRAGGAVVVR